MNPPSTSQSGTISKTLGELSELLGGELVGDPDVEIRGIATLENARSSDLSFLANRKYAGKVADSGAGGILVEHAIEGLERNFIVVRDPYMALADVLPIFFPAPALPPGIDSRALVDASAQIDPTASVLALTSIGAGTRIGARTQVHGGIQIGRNCVIGEDCVLHPNVTVRDGSILGDRIVVHSGAVIGSDGFGFACDASGYRKVPQVGIVRICDDVEIGANSTIDRGSLGETHIGRGVKIDNLVQIAHNVTIGEHTAIAAHVGIAGSSKVGSWVRFAGQVGVVGHVNIADRASFGARSGVIGNVPEGAFYSGFPARDHKRTMRGYAEIARLVEYRSRLEQLEAEVARLRDAAAGE